MFRILKAGSFRTLTVSTLEDTSELNLREASKNDVPALVQLLPDNILGAKREDASIPLNKAHIDAFHST